MTVWLQAAGVPTVPGSDGLVRTPDEAFKVAKEVSVLTLMLLDMPTIAIALQ